MLFVVPALQLQYQEYRFDQSDVFGIGSVDVCHSCQSLSRGEIYNACFLKAIVVGPLPAVFKVSHTLGS